MKQCDTFKRQRAAKLGAWVFIASIALNFLAIITPLAILTIFERVIPHQSIGTLQAICMGLLIAAIFDLLLRRARASILIFGAGRNAVNIQDTFLSRILKSDPAAIRREDPAVHLERYSAIEQLREQDSGESRTLVIDLPFCVLFITMIGLIGGWLITVPLSILAMVLAFTLVTKRAQRGIFERRRSTDRRRYAFLSEVFGHIVDVKANTMERQMARRFEMLQSKSVLASLALIHFSGASQGFGAAIGQLSVAGMGLLGAFFVMQDAIGLAELAACMLLNGRVVQPLTKLVTIWVEEEASASAWKKLREIEKIPTHFRRATDVPMRGVIECVGARLADSNSKQPSTDAFSFHLGAGETLLVDADQQQFVRRLFAALQGHDVLTQGQIYIDGRLPKDWIAKRGRGGLITLEDVPAIFTGTLMENLSGFGRGFEEEYAREIAVALGLERRVRRLPEGYDTPLNAGGFFERDPLNCQLVALTRAIAMRPKILMMYEPSSILNTEERDALQQCLKELLEPPTILVYSPDPRIRNLADKTLALKSAEFAELEKWDADTRGELSGLKRLGDAA